MSELVDKMSFLGPGPSLTGLRPDLKLAQTMGVEGGGSPHIRDKWSDCEKRPIIFLNDIIEWVKGYF